MIAGDQHEKIERLSGLSVWEFVINTLLKGVNKDKASLCLNFRKKNLGKLMLKSAKTELISDATPLTLEVSRIDVSAPGNGIDRTVVAWLDAWDDILKLELERCGCRDGLADPYMKSKSDKDCLFELRKLVREEYGVNEAEVLESMKWLFKEKTPQKSVIPKRKRT
jgi:hypothetical protein